MTEGTFHGSRRSIGKKVVGPRTFAAGGQVCAGGFHIHTIPTPHDGTDPVALVLERKGLRCGILTDLGHPFEKLKEVMRTLHAVILESNYDPHMLKNGRYPESVKRRIFSDRGHISNQEAAMLVREYGDNLNFVMLAHLSKDNNTPELAYRCMMEEAAERIAKNPIKVILAPRHDTSDIIVIRG
jgi:phosphoribosyl 1,2-cyclic phosphodiesterase